MITILIAILQCLGVMATPDRLTDVTFKNANQTEIAKATEIYDTQSYSVIDGVVIVDDLNP